MNEEIKEFIEFRTDEDGTYFYYYDKDNVEQWSYELEKLKDYIINLQQENNDLKNNQCFINYQECYINKKLQQENENLKSQLKGTTHCYDEEEHKRLIDENIALRKGLNKTRIRRTKYKNKYLNQKYKTKDYKSRCEKAIELCNIVLENEPKEVNINYDLLDHVSGIKRILQGGDKE